MSLTLALNNALSGLNVNQTTLAVISNNIANANTEGYSRQVVDQSALLLNGVGSGVRIDAISRKVDVYLERSIQREMSNVASAEKITDYYERIQIMLGEPGSDNSIDEYVENFFNSLQALAETPDRVSFKATVGDTAETLAREISGLATSLEDLRYQADQDIAEAVDSVNLLLRKLDSLNLAINRAAALNTSTAGLLDQRDLALEQLSDYMDIQIYYKESGAVNVFVSNGIGLIDDNFHELSYRSATGVPAFVSNDSMNALEVLTLNEEGEQVREPDILIAAGIEAGVRSGLRAGSIEGLRQLRDELIPDILAQLDQMAAQLRDQVNAIHNDGSGFPPADELTGTRLIQADERYDWTGVARIAVMNADGSPANSTYTDEAYTGYRPLDLDFDFLDSGSGPGVPTMQTIIDEINNHFNAPPVKVELGNLNNIQIVSNNLRMPENAPPTFTFDLDLENISATQSEVWVTSFQVIDALGVNITPGGANTSDTIPRVAIDVANAYSFTGGSSVVTITSTAGHGLSTGDRVYLEDPFAPGPVPIGFGGGGITAGEISGFFEVTVTGTNSFTIVMPNGITSGAGAGVVVNETAPAAFDALPPYKEVEAGDKTRTRNDGTMTADLSLNSTSAFYDVQIQTTVYNNDPDNPQYESGVITYRVYNNAQNLLNDRYDVTAVNGQAQRVFPSTPHQYIFARMVDADGNPLSQLNGSYGSQQGYLQLVANDLGEQNFAIAIDEGTSRQEGTITLSNPAQTGTNRGFSHYFELNNLFVSNAPTSTGDTVTNSAINFAVSQRILDNPSLISTGDMELSNQPSDPDATPLYTVERYIGSNSVAQRLAGLSFTQISFASAGGLPENTLTLNGYIGEMLGFIATKTAGSRSTYSNSETLLNGFIQRADAISGVNLDEELANTVLYQNAYSASARVITVTDELFAELLNTFG